MASWIVELINTLQFQLSIVILLLAGLCLYFGRIILSPKTSKFDRIDTLIQGIMFILSFVLVPVILDVIFIFIPLFINIYVFSTALIIPVIIITIVCLDSFYRFRNDRISFIQHISELDRSNFNRSNYYLNQWFLMFVSWLTIILCGYYIISIILYSGSTGLAELGLIAAGVFISFSILTTVAVLYSYSLMKYPNMKIYYHLENDNTITTVTGKILEIKEFFIVVSENQRIHIRRDKVVRIDKINDNNSSNHPS